MVALGSVIGVWLHDTLDRRDRVQTVAAVKKPTPPAPVPIRETKTVAPDLPPASAGFNHPGSHRPINDDRAGATSSFASLAEGIGGEVGVAVAPLGGGSPQTYGEFQVGHAWSSMKVPILVTRMREGALSPEEESWASSAVTASDNEAAAALFQRLEDAQGGLVGASLAVQHTLAVGGDPATQIATAPPPEGAVSTWGQTEWSLSGSADFYRALACGRLLGDTQTAYVLGLMESVIPEQQWGLGQAGLPVGTSVAFKAGWGPEAASGGAYLVRQAGIVRHGPTGIAVTMMVEDPSGSFEAGVAAIDRIADWVVAHLDDFGPESC